MLLLQHVEQYANLAPNPKTRMDTLKRVISSIQHLDSRFHYEDLNREMVADIVSLIPVKDSGFAVRMFLTWLTRQYQEKS